MFCGQVCFRPARLFLAMLLALNKPFDVLSQFTPELPGQRTLAECDLPPGVYPVGRLDRDSEGLLLLTDERALVGRLLEPERGHPRTYWAQVERIPDDAALQTLRQGVVLAGKRTRRCRCEPLAEAADALLPPRLPPVRFRKNVPTAWLALTLTEGKNRQVRRMTAAVGHPTLRLVRVQIGALTLASLQLAPGAWCELSVEQRAAVLESG